MNIFDLIFNMVIYFYDHYKLFIIIIIIDCFLLSMILIYTPEEIQNTIYRIL